MQKFFLFAFKHFVNRNPRPFGNHFGNRFVGHHFFCPALLFLGQVFKLFHFLFQIGDQSVLQLAGLFKLPVALGDGNLYPCLVQLVLDFRQIGQALLLGFPFVVQTAGFFLQIGGFPFNFFQPFFRLFVMFLFQRFALNFQLHDLAVEIVQLLRFGIDCHPERTGGLVHQVNRLVGQKTVGNITVGKRGRGNQRGIGNPHSVMQFKLFFDPAQNGNRFFNRRFGYEHRLKTPCQRRVFFHVLFIFGKRGRSQTMQLSAGQRRLQQIGSVHRPFRRTGADDRMHFINKQNDSAV